MFLGVSATLRFVDMNDEERAHLATRIRAERVRQFGAKSAAYKLADVNAATWDKLEAGERVREDRLIAAVQLLWPHSGGDWRAIDVAEVPTTTVDQRLADIERRLAAVEQQLHQEAGEGYAPPMSDAEGTSATAESTEGRPAPDAEAVGAGPGARVGSEPIPPGIQWSPSPRRKPTRGKRAPKHKGDGTSGEQGTGDRR